MAKLINNENEREIPDGEPIQDICDEEGIPFGCRNGICASCIIEVEDGEENLEDKNEAELAMDLDKGLRLACQCKIKKGTVKLKQY